MLEGIPTLLAKLYQSTQKEPSMAKDYQYFTVEYSLATLCAIGYSVVREHCPQYKESHSVDYGKMSMGLWMQLLRGLCKEIADLKATDSVVQTFRQMHTSGLLQQVGEFIQKRNHDMHGNPIRPDTLIEELRSRDALIKPLIDIWGGMPEWRLVYFDKIAFDNGNVVYYGYQLSGMTASSIELFSQGTDDSDDAQINIHELYFVNVHNMRQRYAVSPLLIWSSNTSPQRVGVFSKSIVRGQERIEYNSIEGPINIVLKDTNDTPLKSLRSHFYTFLYRFNPNRTRPPEVEASWRIDNKSLEVHQTLAVTLEVQNGSREHILRDLQLHLVFDSDIQVSPQDSTGCSVVYREQNQQGIVEIIIPEISAKDTLQLPVFELIYAEQGHYRLPTAEMKYTYIDQSLLNDDDDETDSKNASFQDNIEIGNVDFEVIDPNSTTPFRPIINTNMYVRQDRGIDIGDEFELVLELENIGFAVADHVNVELVLPDGFIVHQGQKIVNTVVQPRDKVTLSLKLSCWKANIYSVFLRDISYTNVHGKRFVSSATRELYILIQSNKRKTFEYTMIQAYEDLYLEEHEEQELNRLKSITPGITDAIYRQMTLNIRRQRIIELFEDRFAKYTYEPKEVRSRERRDVFYMVHGIPVFGLCLSGDERAISQTQCLSLRTMMRKKAMDKTIVHPYSPLIGEGVFYEEIQKDMSYRDQFFKHWFAMIEKSLKQWLRYREMMNAMADYIGGEQVIFKDNVFSIELSQDDQQRIRAESQTLISLCVDTENYEKAHCVFQLPSCVVSQVLNDVQKASGIQYYTQRLAPASRQTRSVGFVIQWNKKLQVSDVLERMKELWHFVSKQWMIELLNPEVIGGAQTHSKKLSESLLSLDEGTLYIVQSTEDARFKWLSTNRLGRVNTLQIPPSSCWGYFRATKSSIYIAVRCKEGLDIPEELGASLNLVLREGLVFHEWKINSMIDQLPLIISLLQEQHRSVQSDYRVPPMVFERWMAETIHNYGFIFFELVQYLSVHGRVSVFSLKEILQTSKYRVNRILNEYISEVENEHRVIQRVDNDLFLNEIYRTDVQQWLSKQEVVQSQIHATLSMIEEKLEQQFPSTEDWVVEISKTLRVWSMIRVYKSSWQYGVYQEHCLAIALFIDRPYLNQLTKVGILGRFVDKKRSQIGDDLHQMVSKHSDFSSCTVKKSEYWPAYLQISKTLPHLHSTGGAQWKYTTLEAQQQFAQQVVDSMIPFAGFASDIQQTVDRDHLLLKEEWLQTQVNRYQNPTYHSLAITEQKLQLEDYTLAKELPQFHARLLTEDWSMVNDVLVWPWEKASLKKEGRQTKFSMWGRMGINLGSPSWKPGVFIGCLLDGTDHKEALVDPDGGVDLAVIVSVHRSAGQEQISGEEFVAFAEWQNLVERLCQTETELTVIDHLRQKKSNRWHPLHIRKPLADIWKDCSNTEERYQQYLFWLREGVKLLVAGGELQSIIED